MTARHREMYDDAAARTVSEWIMSFTTSEAADSATRHLDQLLWQQHRGDDIVDDSVARLREALEAQAQVGALDVEVRVAIPLRESETLDRHVPSWESLRADLRVGEPPSLYLSRGRELFSEAFPEEFRAAISVPFRGWRSYYVCARDEHAAALGWEFSRTVWIHPEAT